MSDPALPLVRRTWCYVRQPAHFEIPEHGCGHAPAEWSEFIGRLWCDRCKLDFTPAHDGVLGGPIPVQTAVALGVSFDRFDVTTGVVDRFDPVAGSYASEAPALPTNDKGATDV